MSFISYAQNFEDVMLWRALKNVKKGFYIDVGANDPLIDSVTKAFYDYGWHGINIEPINFHYQSFVQERPRDINLLCAVGETNGQIDIFNCDVRGWATGNKKNAERLINEGHQGEYHSVSLRTLTEICQECVTGEIHFLKIDVEGLEKEVVLGADFDKFRPWIIVLEATKPNSTEEAHEDWEPCIFEADYNFAYADGLNRFYVSQEHSELLVSLQYPPNVFDEFIRVSHLNAELRVEQENARAQEAESRATQAEGRAQEAESRATQVEGRAQEAESQATQAESQATQAEGRAQEAESRAAQAEGWAQEAEARAAQAEGRVQEAEARAAQAEGNNQDAELRAAQAESLLTAIYNSRIWRLTTPWRMTGNVLRWFVPRVIAWLTFAPISRPRRKLRKILIYLKTKISEFPLLRNEIRRILSLFPRLETHLNQIGSVNLKEAQPSVNFSANTVSNIEHLTPHARKIYVDLKTAIEQRQKGA